KYGTLIENTQSCNAPSLVNKSLKGLILQMVTITVKIINGDQALAICGSVYFFCLSACKLSSTLPSSLLKRKMCLGFQNLSKMVKVTKDAIAAVISGSSGPTKL